MGKKGLRFALPTLRRRPSGSAASSSIAAAFDPSDDFFRDDPVRLLELFALAAREKLEVHPTRCARRPATPS